MFKPRLLFVLPAFLVIASSLIIFLYVQKPKTDNQPPKTDQWQTYTNLQEGVSFEYPPGFTPQRNIVNKDTLIFRFRNNLISIQLIIEPSLHPEPVDFSQFEKYQTSPDSSTQVFTKTVGTTTWLIRSDKYRPNQIDYTATTFRKNKAYTLEIGFDKQLVSDQTSPDFFHLLSTFQFTN